LPLARTVCDELRSHWDHRVEPGDDEWPVDSLISCRLLIGATEI